MKLVLSVDALTPSLSGIGRYTWELASRLRERLEFEQIRYYRAGHWINDPSSLLRSASVAGGRAFEYPAWAREWYWKHAFRGQVIHAPNYFLPQHAENGVVTIHDLSVFKFPETHPIERVQQFEKLFKKTLSVATHLITDTEATRVEVMDFLGWPAKRITAVHLGVSSEFTPRPAEQLAPILRRYSLHVGGYILCVSTIEPRKRVDALLFAYEQLPAGLRSAYPLVLVGAAGWRSEHLHALIDRGKRGGWLHYFGFVVEADLRALFAGARLFVYPSTYEGFGLPLVEAMASGVPVVTSDRSCLPEVAAGAAKLLNPDDVAALTVGLQEGLEDSEWRERAIARGLLVAAGYDWAECIKQTVGVYAQTLGN